LKTINSSNKKPLFAISSCLAGERVRYDRQAQGLGQQLDELKEKYQLLSLCPEMAIGLGVPRPAMQLREHKDAYHAVIIDNPQTDHTQALRDYARQVLKQYPELEGFILKQKSPSCGTGNTKLFDADGHLQGRDGWGIFADELRKLKPTLIFLDEASV